MNEVSRSHLLLAPRAQDHIAELLPKGKAKVRRIVEVPNAHILPAGWRGLHNDHIFVYQLKETTLQREGLAFPENGDFFNQKK